MSSRLNRLARHAGKAQAGKVRSTRQVRARHAHTRALVVDVISDVRCPWCYVGSNQLQHAIAANSSLKVEVRWHPFFLDDTLSFEGRSKLDYYMEKFGRESVLSWQSQLHDAFEEEGLGRYSMDGIVSHSLHSHRLIALAGQYGLQNDMNDEIFRAYFTRGQNIACFDVLQQAAARVGLLDEAAISDFLQSNQLEDRIRTEAKRNAASGISIPHFTIKEMTGNKAKPVTEIEGVHGYEAFLRAFSSGAEASTGHSHSHEQLTEAVTTVAGGSCASGADVHIKHEESEDERSWRAQNLLPRMLAQQPFPPGAPPFSAEHFSRLDEKADAMFYKEARMEHHLDDGARAALTAHYARVFGAHGVGALVGGGHKGHEGRSCGGGTGAEAGAGESASANATMAAATATAAATAADAEHAGAEKVVVDLCSSWTSHFPVAEIASDAARTTDVIGIGMNQAELEANQVLSSFVIQDLNETQLLPLASNSIDVVTCAMSVEYITQPLHIFQEVHRVLRSGGRFVVSFSDRKFASKAVRLWQESDSSTHVWMVAAYFHYSHPGWRNLTVLDLSPEREDKTTGDPLFVLQAEAM